VTSLLNHELVSRAKLCVVSLFQDIVKDCLKMRNLSKIFLRSLDNVVPSSFVALFILYVEQQSLLDDFSPVRGPVSGGTRLTLFGFHLDAGAEAASTISDAIDETLSVNCVFRSRRRSNHSICVTSAATQPFNGSIIRFTIDGIVVPHTVPPHGFALLPDPTVHSVVPQSTIVR